MSARPSWAMTDPSTYSTIECTIDCGWTTTCTWSEATSNSQRASMISSPLFMSVAESIVIFAPIFHVGCLSASSTVIAARLAFGVSRNGPPDAVSRIRWTLAPRAASPTTRNSSGKLETRSSVRRPTEPVAPSNVIRFMPLSLDPAEPARPPLELGDRAVEVDGAEVRPESRCDPQLGVGDLPQEKVRHAHLAARPDQEVGVRHVGGVESLLDLLFPDVLGPELSGLHLPRERAAGVDELIAPAVVERHHEGEARVVARRLDHVVDPPAHLERHAVRTPEHAETHVALHELRQLRADRPLEQAQEGRHLVLRPTPVLGRERVQRQVAQAERVRGADDRARRLHALPVAGDARQAPPRRPAAIAIHDDRDMPGPRLGAHDRQQLGLVEPGQLHLRSGTD